MHSLLLDCSLELSDKTNSVKVRHSHNWVFSFLSKCAKLRYCTWAWLCM